MTSRIYLWAFVLTSTLLLAAGCDRSPTSTQDDLKPTLPSLVTNCKPGTQTACRDTADSLFGDSSAPDTIRKITEWDPATRTYTALVYSNQYLVARQSFVHVYNTHLLDSIVYWISREVDTGLVFSGYGVYTYNSSLHLTGIDNYNMGAITPYGYIKYGLLGNTIAYMQDGYAQEFDDQGRVIKTYTISSSDTTKYVYNTDGTLIETSRYHRDMLTYQNLAGDFGNGVTSIQKSYDSTGVLIRETRSDSQYRILLQQYSSAAGIDSTVTFSYPNPQAGIASQKVVLDGSDVNLYTFAYDSLGNITQQTIGDSSPQNCLDPLSRDSCIVP